MIIMEDYMPIYKVKVTIETEMVIIADDEQVAEQVANDHYEEALRYDHMACPDIVIEQQITHVKQLQNGWDGKCVPYGTTDFNCLNNILSHDKK